MLPITRQRQLAISMAYLSYCGEALEPHDGQPVEPRILELINRAIPQIPPLCSEAGEGDWEVVWGPCSYTFELAWMQDNMMFVARQCSRPDNLVVAIRGTNSGAILDWLEEDFSVWEKVAWRVPEGIVVSGTPQISQATDTGMQVLLHKMRPLAGMPGAGQSISEFLADQAAAAPINLMFTGHSLAGALAPTLALWFEQLQGLTGRWDPRRHATITTIPFAGATAGDRDFAAYFDQRLGSACDRIHNTLDIVPHAWQTDLLERLPDLYGAQIPMPEALQLVLDGVEWSVRDYRQVEASSPFSWPLDSQYDSYMEQAAHQHLASYPSVLGVPQLLDPNIIVSK